MTSPHEKLAESLEKLRILQKGGAGAIRSGDLTRTHRERLVKNGFLKEVIKGWYVSARPDEVTGESTAWYASFWAFCAEYLNERFDSNWSLSPDQSLLLHVGNMTVPRQLLVRAPKARNKITILPHNTSIFDVRAAFPGAGHAAEKDGLRMFPLPAALVNCSPGFFLQNPVDARAALAIIRDASEVLPWLLENGRTTVAGRLAGAFRAIGRDRIADDIVKAMKTAGYDIREKNPFDDTIDLALPVRQQSPYVNRIRIMWQQMRTSILKHFTIAPKLPLDIDTYLKATDKNYIKDAYHSLSIEGYRISPELIDRVRSGAWDPDENKGDQEHRNALVARGYWQAYQSVKNSIRKILEGNNPGSVAENDHGDWYREMFGPSVTAGILRAGELAGYRSDQVYIRRSMHVPPRYEAVRDCMPVFFDLLKQESEASVRVVLGHFIFVYIHPYMDGNGRIARFLMNVLLASAGYPWTVIPLDKRSDYMHALESASVKQEIDPFAKFLKRLASRSLKGKQVL